MCLDAETSGIDKSLYRFGGACSRTFGPGVQLMRTVCESGCSHRSTCASAQRPPGGCEGLVRQSALARVMVSSEFAPSAHGSGAYPVYGQGAPRSDGGGAHARHCERRVPARLEWHPADMVRKGDAWWCREAAMLGCGPEGLLLTPRRRCLGPLGPVRAQEAPDGRCFWALSDSERNTMTHASGLASTAVPPARPADGFGRAQIADVASPPGHAQEVWLPGLRAIRLLRFLRLVKLIGAAIPPAPSLAQDGALVRAMSAESGPISAKSERVAARHCIT